MSGCTLLRTPPYTGGFAALVARVVEPVSQGLHPTARMVRLHTLQVQALKPGAIRQPPGWAVGAPKIGLGGPRGATGRARSSRIAWRTIRTGVPTPRPPALGDSHDNDTPNFGNTQQIDRGVLRKRPEQGKHHARRRRPDRVPLQTGVLPPLQQQRQQKSMARESSTF